MKRVLVFSLLPLYMAMSSGIAMHTHYCMGIRTGAELFATSQQALCPKCGMKTKKKSCCNDKLEFFKLADAHKFTSVSHTYFSVDALVLRALHPAVHTSKLSSDKQSFLPQDPSPPNLRLYISHCVFRI